MEDALRSLVLLALAAGGLTAMAAGLSWWFETSRRLRRTLRRVLKATPEVEALDPADGRAAGLDFEGRAVAVLWDRGGSGLVYGFDEVDGAELIVDSQVQARVARGEPRRPLDAVSRDAEHVALRLMFADARFPEFELELWGDRHAVRSGGQSATEAVRLGRRWLAHIDALLKQPRAKPTASPPPPRPQPESAPPEPELPLDPPPDEEAEHRFDDHDDVEDDAGEQR